MLIVTYYRTEAKIKDLRIFKDEAEFKDWYTRQEELEHVIILNKESR